MFSSTHIQNLFGRTFRFSLVIVSILSILMPSTAAQAEPKQTSQKYVDFIGNAQILPGDSPSWYRMIMLGVEQSNETQRDNPKYNAPLTAKADTRLRELLGKNTHSQAILVIGNSVESGELFRVEVERASYEGSLLSYRMRVVEDITGKNGVAAASQKGHQAHRIMMYVQDCSDGPTPCFGAFQNMGNEACQVECGDLGYTVGYCWDWAQFNCIPCNDYSAQCNQPPPNGVCNSASVSPYCQGNCTDTQGCFDNQGRNLNLPHPAKKFLKPK